MAETLPQRSHKRSHNAPSRLTRKRGIYYYRRRLPQAPEGEIAVSLRTKDYREAEYLAARLDGVFTATMATVPPSPDLQEVLRGYLREALEADLEARLAAPPSRPVYTTAPANDRHHDAVDHDHEVISRLLSDARERLVMRDVRSVASTVESLMRAHGIPAAQRDALALGVLEANVKALEEIEKRVSGGPAVMLDATATPPSVKPQPSGPKLSEVLPGFIDYATKEKGWRGQTLAQNKATFEMFKECCGDLPVSSYTRRDTAKFYDTLRGLPRLYSKDRRWRDLPLLEVVERSKDENVERFPLVSAVPVSCI